MPFKSKAQMKYMYSQHPKIAKKWSKHTKDTKSLPNKKESNDSVTLGKLYASNMNEEGIKLALECGEDVMDDGNHNPKNCAYKEKIPGGLSSGKNPSDFDQDELMKGIHHEMEHAEDIQTAMEIALDHLVEDPKYYTHLDKCEKNECGNRDKTADTFFDPEEMEKHQNLRFGMGNSMRGFLNNSKDNREDDPNFGKITKTGQDASFGFKQGMTAEKKNKKKKQITHAVSDFNPYMVGESKKNSLLEMFLIEANITTKHHELKKLMEWFEYVLDKTEKDPNYDRNEFNKLIDVTTEILERIQDSEEEIEKNSSQYIEIDRRDFEKDHWEVILKAAELALNYLEMGEKKIDPHMPKSDLDKIRRLAEDSLKYITQRG